MTQEVLVELDLHGNKIQNIADGLADGEAVHFGQLGDYVSVPTTPTPGDGDAIVWDPDANGPGQGGWVSAPTSNKIEAGPGVDISTGTGTGGSDVISAKVAPLGGLSVDPGGLFVDAGAALYRGPQGVAVKVDSSGGIVVGGVDGDSLAVDPAFISGIQGDITAGDDAIIARLDAITITGAGAAKVTEPAADQWVVTVDPLQLANTYVGPGADSGTIAADVIAQGGTQAPGDLYINDSTGQAFICTGLPAPDDWVGLSTPDTTVSQITSSDGSLTVQTATGPVADVTVKLGPNSGLANQGGLIVDTSAGVSRAADGVTVNLGLGLEFGGGTVGQPDENDYITVDKDELDKWYPSIPSTTPAPPPGTTIVWDGDSWELVEPGELPPPAPAGTLIGAATVVVVPGVVVASGTGNVPHNLGNNNVIAVVQNAAGCQVSASVCGGGTDPVNDLTIQAEDGTYTVIVTGIKTA